MINTRFIFESWKYPHDPNAWWIKKGVFTSQECDEIVKVGDSYNPADCDVGYDESENSGHRKCLTGWIPQSDTSNAGEMMWQKFYDTLVEGNQVMWGFDLRNMYEAAQFTRYYEGHRFNYHMDNGKGDMSLRKVSATILLNDPSEWTGGKLQFWNDRTVEMEKGDVVCFPSYMIHRVTPIESGERISVVLWAGGAYYK